MSGLAKALGLASLGAGIAGIARPSLLARLTGTSELEARELGFRDLTVGIGIFASPRVGLLQRALADVGDALVFARRKPWVSALAVGGAALAGVALAREA